MWLRFAGAGVLVLGLAGAYLFWLTTRSSAPSMDDLMPGYSEKRARQNAIQMGNLVVTLLAGADAMKEPANQALLIAGASVMVAGVCFWIASLMERPPQD